MSKILYIGNYRDSNSAGRVSRDYLLALIEAGADVVARPVLCGQPSVKTLDSKILKVENKSSKGSAICVQHLPYIHLVADGRFQKNVAIVGFNQHPPKKDLFDVSRNLEQFDDVICLNSLTQMITGNLGGVTYAHPFNIKKTDERVSIPEDHYTFYFIGKLSQRKNLDAVLRAFHREFARYEPVELLIKTTCDIDQGVALNIINNHINAIKQKVGRHTNLEKYKKEVVTVSNLLDENWGMIHNTGNCLVMPSYGEYTALLPSLALAYGNDIVVNSTFGITEIKSPSIYTCESNEIYTEDSKAANLTNYESIKGSRWYEISECNLQGNMRGAFENRHTKNPRSCEEWSFKSVGEQLLQRILK